LARDKQTYSARTHTRGPTSYLTTYEAFPPEPSLAPRAAWEGAGPNGRGAARSCCAPARRWGRARPSLREERRCGGPLVWVPAGRGGRWVGSGPSPGTQGSGGLSPRSFRSCCVLSCGLVRPLCPLLAVPSCGLGCRHPGCRPRASGCEPARAACLRAASPLLPEPRQAAAWLTTNPFHQFQLPPW